jgi:electron-transferring-flavoprotein dehydrogenase
MSRSGDTRRSAEPGAGFVPADFQPPLPRDRLLLEEAPGEEAVPLDVLFIGGGPAGLAGAIELARLARAEREKGGALGDLEIGVLEKATTLGEHCLSGAVVHPGPFRELFPDVAPEDLPFRRPAPSDRVYFLGERGRVRLPTPPTMHNAGHYVASICEIVRWMGERAEELGVNVFTGFPADALLVQDGAVVGARTTPAGLTREGEPGSGYMPPTDVSARVTVLSEGTRGSLTSAWLDWQGIESPNAQIYALGVKELWRVPSAPDAVIHTLGWPLPDDAFGGSFVYPMGDDLVAVGLVVGLDYPEAGLDGHLLLQQLKTHPLVASILEGGEIEEWGAKTIPEGGFYALPERLHGDGLVIVGDAAGFVDVASLKGIHYAVQSGMLAARAVFRALGDDDVSERSLRPYDASIRDSFIAHDLYRTRNMRLAFKEGGLYRGGLRAALMTLTRGAFPGGRIPAEEDASEPRQPGGEVDLSPDGERTFSKEDAVYRSGNTTRDDIPSHLVAGEDVPDDVADFYAHMCPAGVYERDGHGLVVNAPNCIDCKATDVLGPRWTPREGGSGPGYQRM